MSEQNSRAQGIALAGKRGELKNNGDVSATGTESTPGEKAGGTFATDNKMKTPVSSGKYAPGTKGGSTPDGGLIPSSSGGGALAGGMSTPDQVSDKNPACEVYDPDEDDRYAAEFFSTQPKGVVISATMVNPVLSRLMHNGLPARALRLLLRMYDEKVEPDAKTYDIGLEACAQTCAAKAALSMFMYRRVLMTEPLPGPYSATIAACAIASAVDKGLLQAGQRVWTRDGPRQATVEEAHIKCLEVGGFVNRMLEEPPSKRVRRCGDFMRRLALTGDAVAAVELSARMDIAGLERTDAIYEYVLNACLVWSAAAMARGGNVIVRTRHFLSCAACKNPLDGQGRRCSQCKAVAYCGDKCQAHHWKEHRKTCSTTGLSVNK